MSTGTIHEGNGILYKENGQLIIVFDNSHHWRLEGGFWTERKARKLIGQRVHLKAVRVDFDVLWIKELTRSKWHLNGDA